MKYIIEILIRLFIFIVFMLGTVSLSMIMMTLFIDILPSLQVKLIGVIVFMSTTLFISDNLKFKPLV
jgi:hypothetical protein